MLLESSIAQVTWVAEGCVYLTTQGYLLSRSLPSSRPDRSLLRDLLSSNLLSLHHHDRQAPAQPPRALSAAPTTPLPSAPRPCAGTAEDARHQWRCGLPRRAEGARQRAVRADRELAAEARSRPGGAEGEAGRSDHEGIWEMYAWRECDAGQTTDLWLLADNPAEDPQVRGDAYKTLFVARLSYDTKEVDLEKEFGRYGTIERVRQASSPSVQTRTDVQQIRIVMDTTDDHRSENGDSAKKKKKKKTHCGYGFIVYEREKDMKGKRPPFPDPAGSSLHKVTRLTSGPFLSPVLQPPTKRPTVSASRTAACSSTSSAAAPSRAGARAATAAG